MERRLFVAIEPPPAFANAVKALHTGLPGANWETQPHITMSHFGSVDTGKAEQLKTALGEVSFDRFELHPDRLGVFGDPEAPAVLWLGFGNSAELSSLQMKLSAIRSEFASHPDRHAFNPHLTLARTDKCAGAAVREYVDTGLRDLSPGTLEVADFHLFESINFEYTRIERYPA